MNIKISEAYFRNEIERLRKAGGTPTVAVFPECDSITIGNKTIYHSIYSVVCEVFGMKIFIDSNLPDGQWYLLDESQIMKLEEPKKTLWDKLETFYCKTDKEFIDAEGFELCDVKEALKEFMADVSGGNCRQHMLSRECVKELVEKHFGEDFLEEEE